MIRAGLVSSQLTGAGSVKDKRAGTAVRTCVGESGIKSGDLPVNLRVGHIQIPAETGINRQPMGDTPVVLKVSREVRLAKTEYLGSGHIGDPWQSEVKVRPGVAARTVGLSRCIRHVGTQSCAEG